MGQHTRLVSVGETSIEAQERSSTSQFGAIFHSRSLVLNGVS